MDAEKDKNSPESMRKTYADIQHLKASYEQLIENQDKGLSPRIRLELAEDFMDHPFWRKVLLPAIMALMGRIYIELEDCTDEELPLLQAQLRGYRAMMEFPLDVIKRARDDLAIAGLKNEEEGEV